ncbi:hypothetical protein PoB_006577900 [Plakobranchus ocellatus]|uniref:Uncharacterized protein n=1 Tax=Plakobranchus ocellatus TaxID=259542 RepID=A0AAV4D536_9GAST|nr:hypothetical protein PoB_006577900 [Plakobranchus ocellatus]
MHECKVNLILSSKVQDKTLKTFALRKSHYLSPQGREEIGVEEDLAHDDLSSKPASRPSIPKHTDNRSLRLLHLGGVNFRITSCGYCCCCCAIFYFLVVFVVVVVVVVDDDDDDDDGDDDDDDDDDDVLFLNSNPRQKRLYGFRAALLAKG